MRTNLLAVAVIVAAVLCGSLFSQQQVVPVEQISLRDYFAAQALAGIADVDQGDSISDVRWYSRLAYKYADAMLRARSGVDEK